MSKLTNKDFLKLVMTPRGNSGGLGDETSEKGATDGAKDTAATTSATEQEKKQKKPKHVSARRQRKQHYKELAEEQKKRDAELASKYRDRAAERRKGQLTQDASETEQLLSAIQHAENAPMFGEEGEPGRALSKREQEIADSKFLGGDISRTHLVKGLDFALLQKVREEAKQQEQSEEPSETSKGTVQGSSSASTTAAGGDELKFKTRIGRAIHSALFSAEVDTAGEDVVIKPQAQFQKGRMAFVFNLSQTFASSFELPPKVVRSKTQVSDTVKKQEAEELNEVVVDKLVDIFETLNQPQRDRRKKKREQLSGSGSAGQNEEDLEAQYRQSARALAPADSKPKSGKAKRSSTESGSDTPQPQQSAEEAEEDLEKYRDIDPFEDVGDYVPREETAVDLLPKKKKRKSKSVKFAEVLESTEKVSSTGQAAPKVLKRPSPKGSPLHLGRDQEEEEQGPVGPSFPTAAESFASATPYDSIAYSSTHVTDNGGESESAAPGPSMPPASGYSTTPYADADADCADMAPGPSMPPPGVLSAPYATASYGDDDDGDVAPGPSMPPSGAQGPSAAPYSDIPYQDFDDESALGPTMPSPASKEPEPPTRKRPKVAGPPQFDEDDDIFSMIDTGSAAVVLKLAEDKEGGEYSGDFACMAIDSDEEDGDSGLKTSLKGKTQALSKTKAKVASAQSEKRQLDKDMHQLDAILKEKGKTGIFKPKTAEVK
eukprot:m.81342 g.81342  ORF g.81342 m.81342 type:complete len:716 (+) comp12632_c0_seq2:114-2261(+)